MVLLTGFGLGCILIQILILMRDYWRFTVTRIYSALLAMAGLLLLIPHMEPQWRWLAWDLTTATPALFWLLCETAFVRAPQWYSRWSLIAFYSFLSPALARKLGVDMAPDSPLHMFLWEVPRLCEYLLVLKGGWVLLTTWNGDRILGRRRLRSWVLGIVGSGILGVTLGINMGIASELFIQVTVCACAVSSAAFMLGGRTLVLAGGRWEQGPRCERKQAGIFSTEALPQSTLKQVKVTNALEVSSLARRLEERMSEGFYRTEGLTLRKLSLELGVPLHRLRAVINCDMGYRSFSEYINQLRIQEASARLLAEPDTPVLNIALDAGYRNISSFNRTFKDVTGHTPTDFRKTEGMVVPVSGLASIG